MVLGTALKASRYKMKLKTEMGHLKGYKFLLSI